MAAIVPVMIALTCLPFSSNAQQALPSITLQQAVDSALRNNLYLKSAALRSEEEEALIGSAWDLPRTQIDYEYGRINTNLNDDRIGVTQAMAFPTVYARKRQLLAHTAAGTRWEQALREREVRLQVEMAYHELLVLTEEARALGEADSIHMAAIAGEQQRFDLGASSVLQRATARTQGMLVKARLQQVNGDLRQARARLGQLLNSRTAFAAAQMPLKRLVDRMPDDSAVSTHPLVRSAREQEATAEARWRMERATLLPGITLGISSMTLNGSPSLPDGSVIYDRGDRFTTVRAGISVPLFFGAQHARDKSARIGLERAVNGTSILEEEVRTRLQQARERYASALARVDALEQGAAQEASQLRTSAEEAYRNGQIDRLEWSLLVGQSITLSMEHLDALRALGRASIELDAFNQH